MSRRGQGVPLKGRGRRCPPRREGPVPRSRPLKAVTRRPLSPAVPGSAGRVGDTPGDPHAGAATPRPGERSLQVAQGLSALKAGRDAPSQGEHPTRPNSPPKSPPNHPHSPPNHPPWLMAERGSQIRCTPGLTQTRLSNLMHLHRIFCSFGVTKRLRKGELRGSLVKLAMWPLGTPKIISSKIASAQRPACSPFQLFRGRCGHL